MGKCRSVNKKHNDRLLNADQRENNVVEWHFSMNAYMESIFTATLMVDIIMQGIKWDYVM